MLKKLSIVSPLGLILLAAPLHAIAQNTAQMPSQQPPYWHWPGPWHGPQFWWIWPLMMLCMFLFFIALFFFFRRSWGGQRPHGGSLWHMMDRTWGAPTHSALQILNERFARGEIQKDEYEDKKAAILSGAQH